MLYHYRTRDSFPHHPHTLLQMYGRKTALRKHSSSQSKVVFRSPMLLPDDSYSVVYFEWKWLLQQISNKLSGLQFDEM
jgi:hypothetical protein